MGFWDEQDKFQRACWRVGGVQIEKWAACWAAGLLVTEHIVFLILWQVLSGSSWMQDLMQAIGLGAYADNPLWHLGVFSFLFQNVLFWIIGRISGADWAYDPHWSIHPSLFVLYYKTFDWQYNQARSTLMYVLLLIYALQLTYHYFQVSGKRFFTEEDWRYGRFRAMFTGYGYWFPWSFILVYIVQWAFMTFPGGFGWYGAHSTNEPFNAIDVVAALLMLQGSIVQATADYQMWSFRKAKSKLPADAPERNKPPYINLETGLWRYSRHPNYQGELSMWWASYLFSVAAGGPWWAVIGPVIVTLVFIPSIVLTEMRVTKWNSNDARRAAYAAYRKRTSVVLILPTCGAAPSGDDASEQQQQALTQAADPAAE